MGTACYGGAAGLRAAVLRMLEIRFIQPFGPPS
jgi:hypothetical protein